MVKRTDLRISAREFKQAVDFHGHLGPWLILGILLGKLAIKKIKAKRHFGIKVTATGLNEKPRSCLIDGLQLSTGATFGKGNISKKASGIPAVTFTNIKTGGKIKFYFNDELLNKLAALNNHKESERFARVLLKYNVAELFKQRVK